MECFEIENLSFTYPKKQEKALCNINLTISQGEFITICGKSGCGKTTLLRLLKTAISPYGDLKGKINFRGKPLTEFDTREQSSCIGFVMQSPDNQIVTDKVWHELAFGLESLGYSTNEIRTRVSEISSFFGIQNWFHKKTTELSGGQKQLLNLASVMVMQPYVLILDEPTSQLDPISAQEFLNTLKKINRELGTTIILSEHRLEDAFPISDRIVVMDKGEIIADDKPQKIMKTLKDLNHDMYLALPAPMRIFGEIDNTYDCPVTVCEGRVWLEKYSKNHILNSGLIPKAENNSTQKEIAIEIKDAYFRYEKNSPNVIKGLNLKVGRGELYAIVGGNGTGKTTALSLISGLNTAYRGEVFINGEKLSKIDNLYNGVLGVLPQNPQAIFVKKTVYLDLLEMLSEKKISKEEKDKRIKNISALCCIDNLLESHPYDLSGGEQQRTALAKVLLKEPQILLLDEPTKGIDAHFKKIFAQILKKLSLNGVTVLMVSHDIEFCARYANMCAMFFDGNITSFGASRDFFKGKSFYTTSTNRMARTTLPDAVLEEDVIIALNGEVKTEENEELTEFIFDNNLKKDIKKEKNVNKKLTPKKVFGGIIFAILFIVTYILQDKMVTDWSTSAIQILIILEMGCCLMCFLPKKEFEIDKIQQNKNERKLTKRTLFATLFILVAVPFTVYVGTFYLNGLKYYFISLMIILETMLPFFMVFESRKPQARELIIISVICAIAVAGREAFFMLPQFKPVMAIVIIAGVCFGGETGFLVGAITGFVSNFFMGQGPWTPWQMFSFGIVGFIAGILFKKGFLRKTKTSLCIFGGLATFVIYGGIMNPASVIMYQENPTLQMIVSSYIMGVPYDLIHAVSTSFFLWFISEPMIEKLERIKIKYGIM